MVFQTKHNNYTNNNNDDDDDDNGDDDDNNNNNNNNNYNYNNDNNNNQFSSSSVCYPLSTALIKKMVPNVSLFGKRTKIKRVLFSAREFSTVT